MIFYFFLAPIKPRHRYITVTVIYEGCVDTYKRCARCEAMHAHLVTRCREATNRTGEYEWPDERLDCGHDYQDIWEEAPPPEIAALAFVLPGELGPICGAGSPLGCAEREGMAAM